MTFEHDRIENEKNEPREASSLQFINVPIVLLALFIGFGATYLALRTPDASMTPGDSRTPPASPAAEASANPPVAGNDQAALMEKGKQVYATICQACHQATGAGIEGAFPPLAESEWVTGSSKRLIAIILHGLQGDISVKGQLYQSVMPPFKDQLKSEEIAAVATYIRNSFGNSSALVPLELVDQVREETKARTESWAGEAELNAQKWE